MGGTITDGAKSNERTISIGKMTGISKLNGNGDNVREGGGQRSRENGCLSLI